MKEKPWESFRFWTMAGTIALVLGLAGFSIASGKEIDEEWIIAVVGAVAGAFIIGRSLRAGAPVILFIFIFPSCSGSFSNRPTDNQCGLEQGLVDSLDNFADNVRGTIDSHEFDRAIAAMDEAIEVGRSSVDACYQLRDDRTDVREWISISMRAIAGIVGVMKVAGVNIPDSVITVMDIVNSITYSLARTPGD